MSMHHRLFHAPGASAWCVALALLLLSAPPARAQRLNGPPLAEALKDIPPVGTSCRREDARLSPLLREREPVAPDLSCAIAPAELQAWRERADTTLVDVRPAPDQAAFRIGGSLSMDLSALRTKPQFKTKATVLIGSGKGEAALYAACAALRRDGFRQVRVLWGGLPAWLSQGLPVEGRAPDPASLQSLGAAELWAESRFEGNLVLLDPAQAALGPPLPSALPVRDASPQAVALVLDRQLKARKGVPIAAVVWVASPQTPALELERLRAAVQPLPLLVHAQPPAVFAQQLAQLQAVWTAQARGPRQPPCGQ